MDNPFTQEYREDHDGCVLIYIGNIAVDKRIREFLELPDDLGEKVVCGHGRDDVVHSLIKMFPDVKIVDYKSDEELAYHVANADVLVCPKDELGIAIGNNCGTPVAVKPSDPVAIFVTDFENGVINEDLTMAVIDAATLNRDRVMAYAKEYFQFR